MLNIYGKLAFTFFHFDTLPQSERPDFVHFFTLVSIVNALCYNELYAVCPLSDDKLDPKWLIR